MNYFYDLLINLNEDYAYKFYEWNKDDEIIHLKKIPIIKISSTDLQVFLTYNFNVNNEFLELIHNKTESYDPNYKYIEYMALFTDENNAVVIEFNNEGKSIFRSYLLLEEELDLIEIAYSIKKDNIVYKKLEKLKNNLKIRQIQDLQKFLELEINTLYSQQNISKIRYLYNEVFNCDKLDMEKMYQELLDIIKSDFNDSHLKLFNIIKLSYKHLST